MEILTFVLISNIENLSDCHHLIFSIHLNSFIYRYYFMYIVIISNYLLFIVFSKQVVDFLSRSKL